MDNQNKNLILATALSFAVILAWFLLFPPQNPKPDLNGQLTPPVTTGSSGQIQGRASPRNSATTAATPPAGSGSGAATNAAPLTAPIPRAVTLASDRRVMIDTARLKGSIALTGGRIDDLSLKDYRKTIKPDSPIVTLLSPVGQRGAYYALYGWAPGSGLNYASVPGPETPWSVESGKILTSRTPVTLVWNNGKGLVFRRTISVDQNYMFSIRQSVENTGTSAERLAPYGLIARHGKPKTRSYYILHEGVVRQSDKTLEEIKYKAMTKLPEVAREKARAELINVKANGWIGFTDKYWMTTLIPEPGERFTSVVKYDGARDIYQTETRLPVVTVAAGQTAGVTTMLFAGAKEYNTIHAYQKDLHIKNFVDSIDWGWFFFLTKPIFRALHFLRSFIGNMGWSIIALTFVIKALVFPLAYKSYVSMARMKELQPQMQALKERAGDDRKKLQQEMMALYKKEKVNPASGCLPILLQVPIFFSLYKVIFVTIELRHAPWIGWIRDLSAPDPSSILNLFGLLPYAPPSHSSPLAIISLGALPILLGISMWLQQKLNPAPTDKTQAMVFAWMPWVFMFMLGRFASGLVLYWITNNTITFIQQYTIMRIHGHRPDVFGNIRRSFKRGKARKNAKPAVKK